MRRRTLIGAMLAASLILPRLGRAQGKTPAEIIDGGPYVPTPDVVVDRMLELAGVRRDDIVFDLGSGDGRLVIEAARSSRPGRASFRTTTRSTPGRPTGRWNSTCRKRRP